MYNVLIFKCQKIKRNKKFVLPRIPATRMTHSTQPQPVVIKINLKKVTVRLVLLKQNILFTQRQKYDLPLDKNIQLFAICETTLFSLRIKSTTCLFSIQYSVVCNWCNNFMRKNFYHSNSKVLPAFS